MSQTETKHLDYSVENIQLYHNVGPSVAYALAVNPYTIILNPWAQITQGTASTQRVGDKIVPVGMKLRLWIANKQDRPNVMYRVIVGYFRSKVNPNTGARWTGSNEIIFGSGSGTAGGNNLLGILDPERFKAIKDDVFRLENGVAENASGAGKETHKLIEMWIAKKKKNPVVFDINGNIVNNPFAVFVIPYDSFGTVVTDNISSCAYNYRLYWKDP
jgi:hypothetical protein